MKRLILSMLAGFLCLATTLQAQDKPIVVVSLTNIDQMLDDMEYVYKAAMPDNPLPIRQFVKPYLQGVDTRKPLGGVFNLTAEGEPAAVGFVPVTSLSKVLDTLANNTPFSAEDAGNGLKRIGPPGGNSLLIKEQDGYAFFSTNEDYLNNLPTPAKALKGLNKKFDMAMSLNIQNIPSLFRTLALGTITQAIDSNMQKEPGESEAQFQMRKELASMQLQQIQQFMNETEEIVLGMDIDSSAREVAIESIFTAKAGTNLAQQIAALGDSATQFAGLIDEKAPVSLHSASVTSDEDQIAMAKDVLRNLETNLIDMAENSDEFDTDADRRLAKDLIRDIMETAQAAVEEGRTDFAMVVNQGFDDTFQIIGAAHLPKAKNLESVIKRAVKRIREEEEDFPKPDFDFANYAGVNLHAIEIPEPKNDKEAKGVAAFFGNSPTAYIGFSDDTVWFSFGTGALDSMKAAIDQSKPGNLTPVKPQQFKIALMPFLKRGATVEPKLDKVVQKVGDSPATIKGVTELYESNGARSRITASEGVIRLIGAAVTEAQQSSFEDSDF